MKGTDLKKRLQQEQVMTALDLAELDKEGVIVLFWGPSRSSLHGRTWDDYPQWDAQSVEYCMI